MGAPTLGSHKVEPTNNPLIDGVLAGTAWNAGTGQGTSTITYSFPTSSAPYGTAQGSGAGEYPQPYPFAGFSALTSTQIAEVQRALALVSSYTGLTFTQVTEVPPTATDPGTRGDIRVGNTSSTSQPTAIGFFPGPELYAGDVFFGGTGRNPQQGNFDSETMLHEIGHSLGLKHGQVDSPPFPPLPSDRQGIEFSLMNYASYVGQPPPLTNYAATGSQPQTYMMSDIAALQSLYGANFSRAGTDATYTWSQSSGEEFINGVGQGAPVKDPGAPFAPGKIFSTVWTQGANSTYDLSAFNQNCNLDMRPGGWMRFSDSQLADLGYSAPGVGPKVKFAQGNVYNALLYGTDTRSEIGNIFTGNGDDVVYGNDIFNAITLGNGNDVVNCGGGGSHVFAGDGADNLFGGGGDTFTLTGGVYNVVGGDGNNILDLSGLTPVNGDPFTIDNNNGTGTVDEGTLRRVTFSGITSITQPNASSTIVGGLTGASTPGPIATPEPPSPNAGPTGPAAPVTAATVDNPPTIPFTHGGAGVNAVDLTGPQQSVVLQLGVLDQISGFNPASNTLDVSRVLAQSRLSLSDLPQAESHFGLTDSGSDATLSFYPSGVGAGGGSALATLIGVGTHVTLGTLVNDGALKIG